MEITEALIVIVCVAVLGMSWIVMLKGARQSPDSTGERTPDWPRWVTEDQLGDADHRQ